MKGLARHLYFWVLIGIVLGGILGWLYPDVLPDGTPVPPNAFIAWTVANAPVPK